MKPAKSGARGARHLALPIGAWAVDACVPTLLAAEARRPIAVDGRLVWFDPPSSPAMLTGAAMQLRHAVLDAHAAGLRAEALSKPAPDAGLRVLRRLARFMERGQAGAEIACLAEALRQQGNTAACEVQRIAELGADTGHILYVIAGESTRTGGRPPAAYRAAFVQALGERWEDLTGVSPCVAPKPSQRARTIGATFHAVAAAGLRDVGRPHAGSMSHFVRVRKLGQN